MSWIITIVGLIAPRAIFLWFVMNPWFEGLYRGWILPLLGIIFLPWSLIWYTWVLHAYKGAWGREQVVGLIVAGLLDLWLWARAAKKG